MSVPRELREVEERMKREWEEEKQEEEREYRGLSSDLESIIFDTDRFLKEWKESGGSGDGFVVFRRIYYDRTFGWKNSAKKAQLWADDVGRGTMLQGCCHRHEQRYHPSSWVASVKELTTNA